MTGDIMAAFIAGLCAGSLIMDALWRVQRRLTDTLVVEQRGYIAQLEQVLGFKIDCDCRRAMTRTEERDDGQDR